MKILKRILLILLVLVVIAAITGMFMPRTFRVERSIAINASEKVIFDQVNILKNSEQWSPWQKMDPEMRVTYSGPAEGVGASYDWTSTNKNTGEGTLTITESKPNESIVTELDFRENGKGMAGFNIKKEIDANSLTWWMESDIGGNPFKRLMANLVGKSYVSKVYDQGLNDIKTIAESTPAPAPLPVEMPADTIMMDSATVK